MAAAQLTFSECLVPCWGISMLPSHSGNNSSCTPSTSLPKTMANFELVIEPLRAERLSNFMLSSTCSMA